MGISGARNPCKQRVKVNNMYTLELSYEDLLTIQFVGNRCDWSSALLKLCKTGANNIRESQAWELKEAFEADTDGGHRMFPLLNPDSDLYEKLMNLYEEMRPRRTSL